MNVDVHMLAFGNPGQVRVVTIPDIGVVLGVEQVLELVFVYGQNDTIPVEGCPPVSTGDVIELYGRYWLVLRTGFRHMSADDMNAYRKIDRRDRVFSAFCDGP